jgi:hypothetical protein
MLIEVKIDSNIKIDIPLLLIYFADVFMYCIIASVGKTFFQNLVIYKIILTTLLILCMIIRIYFLIKNNSASFVKITMICFFAIDLICQYIIIVLPSGFAYMVMLMVVIQWLVSITVAIAYVSELFEK